MVDKFNVFISFKLTINDISISLFALIFESILCSNRDLLTSNHLFLFQHQASVQLSIGFISMSYFFDSSTYGSLRSIILICQSLLAVLAATYSDRLMIS
jgi:hypothetical protein